MPTTDTGTDELTREPVPSSPTSHLPQHRTTPDVSPDDVTAQLCPPPGWMAVAPESPDTATGINEFVVVPFPIRPRLLSPQHLAVPLSKVAQVVFSPVPTVVALVNPVPTDTAENSANGDGPQEVPHPVNPVTCQT